MSFTLKAFVEEPSFMLRSGGGLQDIRFLDFRLVVDRDKPRNL